MKIIVMLLSLIQIANAQIEKWTVGENKEIIILDTFSLKLESLKNNDSIKVKDKFIIINCQKGNSAMLNFININDTLIRCKLCNTFYDLKPDAGKYTVVYNESSELTIILNSQFTLKHGNISTTKPNIYYDANGLVFGNESTRKTIIERYNLTHSNKFIDKFNAKLKSDGESGLFSSVIPKSFSFKSLSSSIQGIDVTSLADSLAKDLVISVKKEMAIAIFDDLSKRIRSDSTKDVQTLFKNTYEILDLMGDKIYNFQPYISSIRQNMEYDFQNLPQSFQSLLENDESHIHQLLSRQKNLLYLTGNSLDLGMEIKENVHLGKAIGLHDFNKYHENGDSSLIGILRTLQLFSESLRDTFTADTTPYWIDKAKINKLLNDSNLLQCFIGLLAEVAKKDSIMIGPKRLMLYDFLNDSIGPQGVNKLNTFIKSLQNNITQIQLIHTKDRISKTDNDKRLNVVNCFDAATILLESSRHLINLFRKVEKPAQIDTFFSLASNINGIIKYAVTKKYTLSAMHLAKVMEYFRHSNRGIFKTISFVIDKALIIGQLAEAKTGDEAKEVIESFAAPIGSWRDKRGAKFNLALDSYIGPGYIHSISAKKSAVEDIGHFTVSTPVGITASFMLGKGVNPLPFTIMFSAVDIGPVTARRFTDDTATIGKIYLKEILAPGVHFSVGLSKKLPISFNGGYQQFPLLKKIGEVDLYHKSGISFSINANIPILTLKNEKVSEITSAINHSEYIRLKTSIINNFKKELNNVRSTPLTNSECRARIYKLRVTKRDQLKALDRELDFKLTSRR